MFVLKIYIYWYTQQLEQHFFLIFIILTATDLFFSSFFLSLFNWILFLLLLLFIIKQNIQEISFQFKKVKINVVVWRRCCCCCCDRWCLNSDSFVCWTKINRFVILSKLKNKTDLDFDCCWTTTKREKLILFMSSLDNVEQQPKKPTHFLRIFRYYYHIVSIIIII